jgi:hypothetical protein
MSRLKNARPKDIDRYIKFLQLLRLYSNQVNGMDNGYTLREVIKSCAVSNSVEFAIKKLAIIVFENDYSWTYEWGDPTQKHATQILDFLLDWRKKKQQQPTLNFGTEFQTVIEKLTTISENLNKLLKTPENSVKQSDRVYIAAKIATGVYGSYHDALSKAQVEMINDFVITATDDLISKLYKK